MSDDLNNKIKQITDMLSQDNLPDNVKGLLNLFANSNNTNEPSQKANEVPVENEENTSRSEPDERADMLRNVKKVMDRARNVDDPRINLLSALSPFLNNKRQKKLGNCIKILHMSRMTSIFDDNNK